ncbi:MAG TPA: sigma-70 family RNA polymerase sigma factor [Actinomycetota bacterium]|jgi:DNA-directed RNA polymerase specialized sigma24 family protein
MTWGKDKGPRARGSFEQEWPELARGLDKTLRARHVTRVRREDIIQETALRLFIRWSELDTERPVWPFAVTIAMNLLKDEQRMQARRNASAPPTDEPIGRGVEEEALARLELTNVQIALQKLTPAQRSVLLAEIGAAPYDERGRDALKMLRLRARRTLRNVLGRASVLLPIGSQARVRRIVNSLGVASQRTTAIEQAQGLALSTLGVAGAFTIAGAALGLVPLGPSAESQPVFPSRIAAMASTRAAAVARGDLEGSREGPAARSPSGAVLQERTGRSHTLARSDRSDAPADAQLDAGGTGIDEDPSLESESYRVSIVARAAAAGRAAVLAYEVEQDNPMCGSPADPRDRPCLRPSKPRVRSRTNLLGQGLPAPGSRH